MSEQNFDTQQVIPQDENEELDVFTILKICFAVFIRNWKWFLLSVLVCLILAFVVLKKQSRVYSREATILIESSENNKYYLLSAIINEIIEAAILTKVPETVR